MVTQDNFVIFKQNDEDLILQNIVLVSVDHKNMPRVCVHNYNNCHSVSHFPNTYIVESDTLTYINALSDYFPDRMVTLDVELMINCWFITLVLLLYSLV